MLSLLPNARQAQLFTVSLLATEQQVSEASRVLNAEELARANRFVHADVRRRFIMCRSTLRHLLARELKTKAAQLRFRYEQWGKPQLEQSSKTQIHFNVSHSGDWGLVLIAREPVGVDLEIPNERIQYRAIASQILSPRERLTWEGLPAPAQALAVLRIWVCKEALLKAMGLGIAEGLQQVSLPIPLPKAGELFAPEAIDGALQMHLEDDGTCGRNHWIDSRAWRLQLLDLLPDGHVAVCLPAGVQLNCVTSSTP